MMPKLLPIFFVCLATVARAQDALATQTPAPDPSLPPIQELLRDVEQNQDAADAMRKDYTYHLHEVNEEFNSGDNLKKTETTDKESFRVNGVLVNRTLARDGKALTPEEQKKENERIDKEVAKESERRDTLRAEGKSTDERGDDVLTLSRILQLGTFSNERRVDFNGRPTIAVDYKGDPNAKTKNRMETAFRDIVGTVWIDEQDRNLAHLEGQFVADFKIAGGLFADVKKGLTFSATFRKVNDEAWLLEHVEGRGHGRFLLFVSFNGRYSLTASDYKKFRITTTLKPGTREIDANGNPVIPPDPKP